MMSPEQLGQLVSSVTQTMFGMSFSLAASDSTLPQEQPWCTTMLPIKGTQPITVVVASDLAGGRTLGAAMMMMQPHEVDESMAADSMGELTNIIAGQVRRTLGLDQSLGLPRRLPPEMSLEPVAPTWRSATLRNSETSITVWVAIAAALL